MADRLLLLIVMTFVISLAFPLSSVNAECCSAKNCDWELEEEVTEVVCYYNEQWYNCSYYEYWFYCPTRGCYVGTCPFTIPYDCLVSPTCGPLIFDISPCEDNWVCIEGFEAILDKPEECDQEHCFFGSDCAYGVPECCTLAYIYPPDP